MQLALDRAAYPWLQPKYFDMHLLDNSCRPYHVNFTHIIVKTSYGDCKTEAENSSHGVTYRNILMALVRVPSGIPVTRVPDVWFPFQCRADHKKMASIPSTVSHVSGDHNEFIFNLLDCVLTFFTVSAQ